jgi:membrane-associated PAP2 superfamily phosphatase
MYDFSKHEFTWKHNWFAAVFMHQSMKVALIAFGLALLALLVADYTILSGFLANDTRRGLRVAVASFIMVPLVTSALKSTSIHACPWDLERYGGTSPYLRLFESLPEHVAAGHCFPAGHASSGLWLAAFAVFWLPRRPMLAAASFVLGLMPGAILGWVQQMRGAHFLSHTLWSMWWAGLVIVVLARLLYSSATTELAGSTQPDFVCRT